ncbi:hypothetical protein YYC_00012 [Plasmodium yoelii 17X]|uniref:YIR protein n=1 Tax=Plasmodium yoelii 17X TaxID=1323249 RepID=V7PWM6_PLAYE|nr:hypothetical protein YYC_00012 [Plasmodium yoelii 17X]
MDYKLCGRFDTLRNFLPDELNTTTELDFHKNGNIKNYCPNQNCNNDIDKINAGSLWLFEQLFVKNKKSDINIVEYIIIWLSYMLSIKNIKEFKNVNEFYKKHIENKPYYINCDNNGTDCSKSLKEITGYANYKEIIDKKKDLLNMDINNNIISNLYKAFKLLCGMYSVFTEKTSNCKKCSENVNQFVEKYNKINEDSNNTDNSPYRKILSTLSADYNSLKDKCKGVKDSNFPTLQTIEEKQPDLQSSEPISEVASSSSSIVSKLIPVLSTLFVIAFFLGISYKYSLFGFRKRSQKQHLREKLKK